MSLQIDYPITVDLKKPSSELTFAVQGDGKGRRLIVTVVSDKAEVDISDCTAHLKCSFEGKTVDISACEIEGNRIIAPLTSAMLVNSGKHLLQLTLFDGSGAVISSPIIHICVSESISDGELSSTPEFSALNALTARIESVLNDPEVGDSEVKDARGGYALLGDRISALEAAGINALSFKGAKNCIKHSAGFTAESIGSDSFYTTGLTLSAEDGCAVAEGTAGTPCSVYALFDEPITLARDSSRRVLAVMRMKAVQSDLRVYPLAGRYSGYYNYLCDSNIIESNITEHVGTNSYVQPLKKGEWLTIWALLGDTGKSFKLGGDETQLNGLGVYIPTQTDGTAPKLMIQSVCAYVSDSEERDLLNDIRNSVNTNSDRLTIAEDRIDDNARVIENLQTSTDNTNKAVASLSEAVNNSSDSVAEVKSVVEDMQRNISEFSAGSFNDKKAFEALQTTVAENGERLAEAESSIEHLNNEVSYITGDIEDIKSEVQGISSGSEFIKKYSVSFAGSSCVGTRMDSAVGMQAGVQIGTDGDGVINDFDNVSFFNRPVCCCSWDSTNRKWRVNAYEGEPGFARDGSNGEVMYECTPFWYKADFKGEGAPHYVSVTGTPCEGYTLAPMFKNSYDKVYCPSYWLSMVDGVATSRSGVYPKSGSLNSLMSNARTFDDKAHLETIEALFSDYLLMLVEFATKDFQSVMLGACSMRYNQEDVIADIINPMQFRLENVNVGEYVVGQTICIGSSKNTGDRSENVMIIGINGGENVQYIEINRPVPDMVIGDYISSRPWINGATDIISASSGTVKNDGKHPCIWRGKVDPWGNIFTLICNLLVKQHGDGSEKKPYYYRLAYLEHPKNYNNGAITEEYIEANYIMSDKIGYVKTLSSDSRYPFLIAPTEVGASTSTYAAANYIPPESDGCMVRAGGYLAYDRSCSPVMFRCMDSPSRITWNESGRLSISE